MARGSRSPRREEQPFDQRPQDMSAARALILFGRSLLSPPGEEKQDFAPLRSAIELAQDPEYKLAREAYYQWMRDLVRSLTDDGKAKLGDVVLNQASVEHARRCPHDCQFSTTS